MGELGFWHHRELPKLILQHENAGTLDIVAFETFNGYRRVGSTCVVEVVA